MKRQTEGSGDRVLAAGECDEIGVHLDEFVDHELTDAQISAIASHLAGCEGCSDQVSFELAVRSVLRRSCCEQAPEHLRARVVAAFRIQVDPSAVAAIPMREV